ncbi:hypothetical protein C5S29_00665 [ANME-1 cluster archaeon GoMg3.2]|nr:hypothetical protein [ANME-1 cluster archaeon GoMg3.2]
MRREEAEEIYDTNAVFNYLLDKDKLAVALTRHPVDLFIGVTQTKVGKLAFIVIKRTIAAKKIISPFTIEDIDGNWMHQFREVLSNLTINEQRQNGGFDKETYMSDVEKIKEEGKLLFDHLIPGEMQDFVKEYKSVWYTMEDKDLVDKIVAELHAGKTEKLKTIFEDKQPTGTITIMNEKDDEWEILEEMNREEQKTYYAYNIKKEDEKLKVYKTIDSVWINYDLKKTDQEKIDPVWELLYVSGLPNGEEFFWCDRFSIARVDANYDFPEPQIQIGDRIKVAIISNDQEYANEERDYLNAHVNGDMTEIRKCDEIRRLDDKIFNILHLATHYDGNREIGLEDGGISVGRINRKLLASNIVFMNTCNTQDRICFVVPITLGNVFKNKNAWIGTNWMIVGQPASDFAKCFYDNFLHGIPIARSVKEARKKIRDTNIMYLAYTVYGHPFTRLVRV